MISFIKQKITEPYVKLQFPKTKLQRIIYNQTYRQNYKLSFYQNAFDFLYSNNICGDYFEFGVHRARTFRFALYESYMRDLEMDFFAFDSFVGLPNIKNNESQNNSFKKGLLKTNVLNFKKLIKPFVKNRNIEIVEGFYSKSLTNNLINNYKKRKIKVSMINVDCDLNQSVRESLNFALHFIQNGTVLYIDDYYLTHKGHPLKGNPKIVKDLLKKNKIIYEPWHICGASGKSFLLYKK